jgi:hypothetical protein
VQIIALGLLMGAAQATGQNSDRQGLLWEITASSGKPSYLYGTIHSEDPRVTNLNGTVQEKFDQADVFCAEMQLDMATQLQMTQGMLYLNGQTLDQKISPELFKKTASLVSKYGIPEQLAPMLKPWAAGLLLSVPVPRTGQFLDYMLYQQAQAKGKQLCGLETPQEVVELFDETPMKTQIGLLQMAVREHASMDKMLEEMIGIYLERDLDKLRAYSDRELEKTGSDVSALINDGLVTRRNRNMLESMQAQMKKGSAFIAVGALHLPGKTGLLSMLEQQGYRVRPIY